MNGYDPAAIQAQNMAAAAAASQMQSQGLNPQQAAMMAQQQAMNNGIPLHMQGQGTWMRGNGGRTEVPLGGAVAQSMRPNPYLLHNGRYRKPTHQDIFTEIKRYCGLPDIATVTRVDDFEETARHVCLEKPYLHFLPLVNYPVTMPEFITQVQFYVHLQCGTIFVYRESMP